MCGFVATFNFAPNHRDMVNAQIKEMNTLIKHRGPDDTGYWSDHFSSLGFSRLSIQDTSEDGHQPMISPCKRYIICFNGEIYNFIELKKILISEGVHFFSKTDTEVVLNAYLKWGQTFLDKLIGMFSLIIYDKISQEVFIARDQLGIKPLYYLKKNNQYFFSSEIKAFAPIHSFEINESKIYEQLYFRYVSGESTIYKDIKEFPRATYGILNRNTFNMKKYYFIEKKMNTRKSNENISKIESLLTKSILLHTRSDVGYCVQLSGGIDSSLITAILSKKLRPPKTYSISLNDAELDESQYQHMVASEYSNEHFKLDVNSNTFVDNFIDSTYYMDMPIIHFGCIFLRKLCSISKNYSPVIITGEGADELFGGYSRYKMNKIDRILYYLHNSGIRSNMLPDYGKFKTLKEKLNEPLIYKQLYFDKKIMDNFTCNLKVDLKHREEIIYNINHNYDKLIAHDQETYLSSLLDRQDRMSMSESVEARVPFCNIDLFNILNNISFRKKIENGETKYILKKIAEKYLPHSLIYRRKKGLTLPMANWTNQNKMKDLFSIFFDKSFKEKEYFNHKNIHKAIDDHYSGKFDYSKYLLQLLSFEIWSKVYIKN